MAQTVVKDHLEPHIEPQFHEDSYGYRPKKSALEAVGTARKRCWQYNWAIDLDIKQFFDTIDHDLIMKAVRHHTHEKWIHLYIERWLKVPIQTPDGKLLERRAGTPQGGVISPLLANLFMHYAFDVWMKRHFPTIKFERYADDILVHCDTQPQAKQLLEAIKVRLKDCGLTLHPEKTKIVCCKRNDRNGSHEHKSFDFLGYTFRTRLAKSKAGAFFVSFLPAISKRALNAIRKQIRRWRIHLKSDKNLADLASMFNVRVQGWINYYAQYYKSAINPALKQIERYLIRWVMRKYKRFKGRQRQAARFLGRIRTQQPNLFVHWRMGLGSAVG